MKPFSAIVLSLAVGLAAGAAGAQSTGGFSPSSSGAAAAGGSPVGTVVPWTVQMGSTAPTQPGHTINPSGGGSYGYRSSAAAPPGEARASHESWYYDPDEYSYYDRDVARR
jgi:hypothetical protein